MSQVTLVRIGSMATGNGKEDAVKIRARQGLGGENEGCEKPKPPPLIL